MEWKAMEPTISSYDRSECCKGTGGGYKRIGLKWSGKRWDLHLHPANDCCKGTGGGYKRIDFEMEWKALEPTLSSCERLLQGHWWRVQKNWLEIEIDMKPTQLVASDF